MPRPTLHRKTLATRKAVGVTTTAAATAPALAEATKVTIKESGTTLPKDVGGKSNSRIAGAAKKATVAIGRVTRGRDNVEKSFVSEEGEGVGTVDGGLVIEQEGNEDEEKAYESKKAGRVTRGRGKKVDAGVEVDKKGSTKGKKDVIEENSVTEDRVVEETPVKGRATRKRGNGKEDSVDPDLTPKGPRAGGGDAAETEEIEDGEEGDEEGEKEQGVSASQRTPKPRAGAGKAENKKEDKGKGRAIDEDEMEQSSMEIPSSPPAIPMQGYSQQSIPDDLSSTSSIYGDENFLPPPLASSTPKGGSTTTLPVTPPKPLYRSSEGYTPPPQTAQRTGGAAGPSTVAGPSVGNLSPVRRRLWESSPAPTSPHPLSQLETPKTAAVVDEGPLGFDIYEDSSPTKSPQRQDLSRVMDIDRDARGDGAGANVLRTPKKPTRAEIAKKRTSTGTRKSPDGKIIEEEEPSDDDDESDISDLSEEETPKPVPVEAKPKRQKRGESGKSGPVLTKDLLDLAPRRRRTGKARTTRNKAPIVDDLGEDLTSELEEEASVVAKKRGVTGRKGGKASTTTATTTTKDKGTTITKKAPVKAKGKTTTSTRDNTDIPTATNKSTASTANKSSGKTYGRSKSIPDNARDSSLTPVPADKENEFSETGTDEAGVSKAGRQKLNEIKKAFKEVDNWKMEFEDVSIEGSSEV